MHVCMYVTCLLLYDFTNVLLRKYLVDAFAASNRCNVTTGGASGASGASGRGLVVGDAGVWIGWAVNSGRWTVGGGQWAVGSGQWAVGRAAVWCAGSCTWPVAEAERTPGSSEHRTERLPRPMCAGTAADAAHAPSRGGHSSSRRKASVPACLRRVE